ncbi:hypothetical protein K461DRAFT_136805 [Myriangium duriaei CBS 260.36]|uniref:Uncharacterized protein n=1 Tax=Myriangium duriaei CBS 260.36 TaxID=1168546 RepID=A0A9P4J0F4_9PEZI|nr:hypothetical protein K461DRAFT_136805 [Myriangium duriaei CBS 260.36]
MMLCLRGQYRMLELSFILSPTGGVDTIGPPQCPANRVFSLQYGSTSELMTAKDGYDWFPYYSGRGPAVTYSMVVLHSPGIGAELTWAG